MFYNHHFIGMHWIWWVVLVTVIILLLFNVIPYRPKRNSTEDALDILKKRFARGEIEREEFEDRRRILVQNK